MKKKWLVLILLFAFAFILRILHWQAVFPDGNTVRFIDGDSFYHMRRILLALRNGMHVPEYDPYMNFPDGLICRWTPLFDQIIAVLTFFTGDRTPDDKLAEVIGAFIPPLFGSLAVVFVYFIAHRYMCFEASVMSGFFFAILPYSVQIGVIGRTDHHVAVILAVSLFIVALTFLKQNDVTNKTVLVKAFYTGILCALLILLWNGSSIFLLFLLFYFLLLFLCNCIYRYPFDRMAIYGITVFLTGMVIVMPFVAKGRWGMLGVVDWRALSWFQPIACGFLALFVTQLKFLLDIFLRTKQSRTSSVILAIGAFLVFVISAGFFSAALIHEIGGGINWLVKKDPLLVHVVENQALTFQSAAEDFTFLVYLFPIIALFVVIRLLRRRKFILASFFIAWGIITGVVTIFQERFADLFSIIIAVYLGIIIHYFIVFFRYIRGYGSTKRRQPYRVIWLAGIICFCMALFPSLKWLFYYIRTSDLPHLELDSEYHMAQWIKNNTTPTSGYMNFSIKPEYSILANWSRGNILTYVAQRPNVANNIGGYEDNRDANIAPYVFFVSTNLVEGESILRKYEVRYIIVEEFLLSGLFGRMIDILGLQHNDYFYTTNTPAGPLYSPKPLFYSALGNRLYLWDGAGLKDFKLVYESPYQTFVGNKKMPILKVFEYLAFKKKNNNLPE